jgi:hypothetical protein
MFFSLFFTRMVLAVLIFSTEPVRIVVLFCTELVLTTLIFLAGISALLFLAELVLIALLFLTALVLTNVSYWHFCSDVSSQTPFYSDEISARGMSGDPFLKDLSQVPEADRVVVHLCVVWWAFEGCGTAISCFIIIAMVTAITLPMSPIHHHHCRRHSCLPVLMYLTALLLLTEPVPTGLLLKFVSSCADIS